MNGCTICGDDEARIICHRDKCQEIFWRERAIANPWAKSSAKQSTKSKGEE